MSIDMIQPTSQASTNDDLQNDDHLFGTTTRDCTEREISAQDEALLTLMKRLGIESPLSYETRHLPIERLIVLSENMLRSPAWIEELKALVELVDEGVGMTDTELAKSLGIPVTRVREQLKLAHLPTPLLSQIFAGNMSQGTAKQLVRLSKTQQAFLASLAEMGEEITAGVVEQILRRQISTGLAPLQEMLAQRWEEVRPETVQANGNGKHFLNMPEPVCSQQAIQEGVQAQDGNAPEVEISFSHLLSTLSVIEKKLPQCQETARARLLTKALCQELELLQRQQTKNGKA